MEDRKVAGKQCSIGGGYPGPRCTPTVDGGLVYALGLNGDLVCLNVSDGVIQWRKDLKKDFGGEPGGWGYCGSPLVDGEKLLITPGGGKATLAALNKKTGETIWVSQVPEKDAPAIRRLSSGGSGRPMPVHSSSLAKASSGVRGYDGLSPVALATRFGQRHRQYHDASFPQELCLCRVQSMATAGRWAELKPRRRNDHRQAGLFHQADAKPPMPAASSCSMVSCTATTAAKLALPRLPDRQGSLAKQQAGQGGNYLCRWPLSYYSKRKQREPSSSWRPTRGHTPNTASSTSRIAPTATPGRTRSSPTAGCISPTRISCSATT